MGEKEMCASSGKLTRDIYGREVTGNTLATNKDPSCSNHYSEFPVSRTMASESYLLPYVPTAPAGYRNGHDFMGVGRDHIPKNLYGRAPYSGFSKEYPTLNNAPPEFAQPPRSGYVEKYPFKYDFSSDATHTYRIY
jgi:hypothetical protein